MEVKQGFGAHGSGTASTWQLPCPVVILMVPQDISQEAVQTGRFFLLQLATNNLLGLSKWTGKERDVSMGEQKREVLNKKETFWRACVLYEKTMMCKSITVGFGNKVWQITLRKMYSYKEVSLFVTGRITMYKNMNTFWYGLYAHFFASKWKKMQLVLTLFLFKQLFAGGMAMRQYFYVR